MPSVAVGVDIRMSPVLATDAATKATVPLAISNSAPFCWPPSSYTKLSTVIRALAVRLKVVASLKVTPSVEFADVCSTSFRKMSSLSLSGVAALLRVTVAAPVRVATLPIGSSATGGAGDGAVTGAGAGAVDGAGACACACAGWACASLVGSETAADGTGERPASTGDGMAQALPLPASMTQPRTQIAIQNFCRITV